MQKLSNQILDLRELEKLSTKLCKDISVGDIYLFQGELGAGKTTFIRLLINNLFELNNLPKPSSITSPTFPILITYELNSLQIYHYDLYRLKNLKELEELDFFENLNNNITFIEWPEMLISLPLNKNHYLINLHMISETKRKINICFKQ
ncbi:tRNA (adenosine(37)-N6)-threonylcarbamoyltransferase complex ATPase subunit type 1 TsaE [Pelagibacteraceae bacterium]|nr:tRNA (adenosine(37)-N6)-threonylcarbamoyltransferase complex ATPase subunit type 1 TsaE [Pelagibacteraceae bacterium]